eukprot:CAMPEP_0180074068 /NCGR_PEP_ID=MMETSP0985-20121206/13692_1 /TAXON_ID=483367 /ORGANISM="non described non described, Strain CCMP 2436" /LENGTH=101 /DNA_ID=CAMNT_0022005761 /DNA_START=184 /DNA_END=489 /DNA_ORIENTATION=+
MCNPAPVFCMMAAVTMYLKGLLSPLSLDTVPSITSDVHCGTRECVYVADCITCSIDSLTSDCTSSGTNAASSDDCGSGGVAAGVKEAADTAQKWGWGGGGS